MFSVTNKTPEYHNKNNYKPQIHYSNFVATSLGAVAGYLVPVKPLEKDIITGMNGSQKLVKGKQKVPNYLQKYKNSILGAIIGALSSLSYDIYKHNKVKSL